MVDIIEPNAPTITIKLLRSGALAINAPEDKMLALAMLSVATAIVHKSVVDPAPLMAMPPGGKLS